MDERESFFPMLKKGSLHTAISQLAFHGRSVLVAVFVCIGAFGLSAAPVFAQTPEAVNNVQQVSSAAGLGPVNDLPTIIGRLINVVLGFVGILLLAYMLYAGFLWMTSEGDPKQIQKAKDIIRQAIIGLLILASSFAIARFILNWLSGESGGGGGITVTGPGGYGFPNSAGSLGAGIVESHIPVRDARGVPRNTSIAVTFKEPMRLASVIQGYGDNATPGNLADDTVTTGLNADTIKIYKTTDGRTSALTTAQVRVAFTQDRRTFVFRPVEYLGSPTVNTSYTVELTSGIQREDGRSAFTGPASGGYRWQFEVSTIVDNTPPKVVSVIPYNGGRFAPNVVVQVNFDEAIDPTSASGVFSSDPSRGRFINLEVASDSGATGTTPTLVTGEFKIANQYKTVEFISDSSCGFNSCGRQVFCLPYNSSIQVTAKAATLSENPPQASLTASGWDGVVDMAANSLDGNNDGTAQGQGPDNKSWRFGTEASPDLNAPKVTSTIPPATNPPSAAAQNLPLDHQPKAQFDYVLQASTVNSDNVLLKNNEPNDPRLVDTFWWTVGQEVLGTGPGGAIIPADGNTVLPQFGRIAINHRPYLPPVVTSSTRTDYEYDPFLNSGIQNIYQNCFNPAASPVCNGPTCCNNRSQASCNFPPTP